VRIRARTEGRTHRSTYRGGAHLRTPDDECVGRLVGTQNDILLIIFEKL
jgi:hypothetical protein